MRGSRQSPRSGQGGARRGGGRRERNGRRERETVCLFLFGAALCFSWARRRRLSHGRSLEPPARLGAPPCPAPPPGGRSGASPTKARGRGRTRGGQRPKSRRGGAARRGRGAPADGRGLLLSAAQRCFSWTARAQSAVHRRRRPPSAQRLTISATTATVACSPEPLSAPMAQAWLWHTHPDVSPFMPLGTQQSSGQALASASDAATARAQQQQQAERSAPEGMQVEPAPVPGAAGSSGAAGPSSAAGPSGAQPAAAYDAAMADPAARKPPRKHADAPMRKLSVSLIDTYKLINQVRRQAHTAACACTLTARAELDFCRTRAAGARARATRVWRRKTVHPSRSAPWPGAEAARRAQEHARALRRDARGEGPGFAHRPSFAIARAR